MNNSSLLTADRTTHLKIVLVSLICATVIAAIGIANRMNDALSMLNALRKAAGAQ